MAGIMGEDGPLDALKHLWGERDYARRTHGSPQRTQFIAALWALAKDGEHIDQNRRREAKKLQERVKLMPEGTQRVRIENHAATLMEPLCASPELERYTWFLATAWAGEFGWDTTQLINGVKAASSQTNITQHQGEVASGQAAQ